MNFSKKKKKAVPRIFKKSKTEMSVRNSAFRNGKAIPEAKPQETQAGSEKMRNFQIMSGMLFRAKQATNLGSLRPEVSFPKKLVPFDGFFPHLSKVVCNSASVHQISAYQLVAKLALSVSYLGRRGEEK